MSLWQNAGRIEREASEQRSRLENEVSLKERSHADLAEQAGLAVALTERLAAINEQRTGLTEREHGLAERGGGAR